MLKRYLFFTSIWAFIIFFWALPALAEMIVDTAWVRRYNGQGNSVDQAYGIAVDGSGNVYVTGASDGNGENPDYATIKYYPNGDTAWVRRYNGPGNSSDWATDIAVDVSGNVYVTGCSFGSGTITDYATIKYYPNGDTAWVRRYNGPENGPDEALAIAIDNSNNVFVTGNSGAYPDRDYVTVKYYANGDIAWVRRYNGSTNYYGGALDIVADGSGNVYVTGSGGSETYQDYITMKYYTNGDTAWVRRYNGPGNSSDWATDIAVDGSGNVYVTGGSVGSGTYYDYATIKYYSNGDTAWVRRYNGPENFSDSAWAIAVDGSGNVYVTGASDGNGENPDYATIKYYPNGDTAWVRRYNGSDDYVAYDCANAIAVDGSGDVYVTGSSIGSVTGWDYATIKYYPDGDTAWVRRYDGPGHSWDWAYAIAVDGSGNVYVTGSSWGSGTDGDYATIKYVQGTSFPVLSWADKPSYLTDGVSPDTGLTGTLFTFRVVYSDSNNLPPQSGFPKVNIDLNGDGDFDDENEGSFTMGIADVDTNYVDGREYLYNATLPASSNCQYSFSAKNSYGLDAVGEPTNLKAGPVILSPDSALDLYIHSSDITFSDPHPDEGENFTVFATVHNNSDSNLTDVSVTFYHSEELLDQVMLSNVPSHGSATASTQISFGTKGFYPIRVVVDEENSFIEWNELNNFAMRPVIVGDYVFPGGIMVEAQLNSPVYPHSWITVTGNAHYTPEYLGPVSGATVKVTVQETGAEYTDYTNDPGNFSIGFYGPTEPGNYLVIVEVTDYTLTDSTILNLNVLPPQSGVDLTITMTMPDTGCLSENEENTVDVKIFNLGNQDAQNFWTCIYKDASLYYRYWVNQLPAGDSLQLDTIVSFPSIGWHTVTGIVDAGDSVSEYNEGNNINTVSRYVNCNTPDIAIINVVFSDHMLKGERPIDITAWVVNLGGVAVNETFGVVFSDNGIPFDTQYITSLAPCGTQTAYVVSENFVYSDTMSHSFSVFADFENDITECNEENNIYFFSISAWPDLWPRNLEFSRDCFTWGDSLWFKVDVYNVGEVKAESIWIRFLLDEVPIGGDVFIDSILPGAGHYDTRLSGAPWIVPEELDVTHVCRVVVDPDNEIPEIREDNNELTRATPVVRCGDITRDCVVDIGDIIYMINYLYKNGPTPRPLPAGDVNSDQVVDIGDVVYLINYLFKGGPAPVC